MTVDERIHQALIEHVQQWRAEHAEPAPLDLERVWSAPRAAPRPRLPRRVGVALSAAALVLLGGAAVVMLWRTDTNVAATHSTGATPQLTSSSVAVPIGSDVQQLTGADWLLTSYLLTRAPTHPVPAFHRPTLRLDAAGTFEATDGCNNLDGTLAIGKATLTFRTTFSTTAFCQTSLAVASMLDGPADWHIADNTLTISKPGVGQLVYVRR